MVLFLILGLSLIFYVHCDIHRGCNHTPTICISSGWSNKTRRCFYFCNDDEKWEEAKQKCSDFGGSLAIDNALDVHRVLYNISQGRGIWLGGKTEPKDWHWVEDRQGRSYPSQYRFDTSSEAKNCVRVNWCKIRSISSRSCYKWSNHPKLEVSPCSLGFLRAFRCQKKGLVKWSKSFKDAFQFCKQNGSWLMARDYVNSSSFGPYWPLWGWVAATRLRWIWLNKAQISNRHWAPDQHYPFEDHCLALHDNKWISRNCDDEKAFICEKNETVRNPMFPSTIISTTTAEIDTTSHKTTTAKTLPSTQIKLNVTSTHAQRSATTTNVELTTTETTTESFGTSVDSKQLAQNAQINGGIIAGATVGAIVFICIVIILICVLFLRKRSNAIIKQMKDNNDSGDIILHSPNAITTRRPYENYDLADNNSSYVLSNVPPFVHKETNGKCPQEEENNYCNSNIRSTRNASDYETVDDPEPIGRQNATEQNKAKFAPLKRWFMKLGAKCRKNEPLKNRCSSNDVTIVENELYRNQSFKTNGDRNSETEIANSRNLERNNSPTPCPEDIMVENVIYSQDLGNKDLDRGTENDTQGYEEIKNVNETALSEQENDKTSDVIMVENDIYNSDSSID